jgi:putative nucleotidyltransferase with HDIG domain
VTIRTTQLQEIIDAGVSPSRPVSRVVARKVATERILAELDRLAPLPTVVTEVIRTAEDPDSSVSDLEKIITHDLVITARVIKLANSAFYAGREPTKTIGTAVKRLGFKTIKNLVVAAGAGKALMKPMRHYAYNEFGLWQHSLGLALVVRSLARHLGLPFAIQDELFLAGLMHDIGKLVLDPILAEFALRSGWLTTDMETAAVGLDHAEVGRRVATKWKLPNHTVAVIKQHHELEATTDFTSHIAVIHLGDCLINHAKVGIAEEVEVACEVNPTALGILQLDSQSVQQLQEAVIDELPNIIGMCEELAQC